MKTKNKLLALLEIAIVLCSVFLVALPPIAAEQTTQKVRANTITTASEDDYVLGVYGNANEDDTIDMRDLTYVKLIFFGKKPETELADAKCDGKINPLDFIQIKLIIVGKEKELTIVQYPGWQWKTQEPVTVPKPVERVVVEYMESAELMRILNAKDKVVGVGSYLKQWFTAQFPELSKLPGVGGVVVGGLDYEAVLSLRPDMLLSFSGSKIAEEREKLPGVAVVFLGYYYTNIINPEKSTAINGIRQLGYILDKEEEAEEYVNWLTGWVNEMKSRTEGLSEDKKPKVFSSYYTSSGGMAMKTSVKTDTNVQMCILAGGKNIAEDLPEYVQPGTGLITVDPEWVIEQNPDIIILQFAVPDACDYSVDDPSEAAAVIEEILNNPVFANVNAIKTGNVYLYSGSFRNDASCGITGAAYLAKVFHPDLFEDLDPEAVHQEYLDLQHFDYDLDEHGMFVYPPIITGEGKLAGIPDRYYDSRVAQP